MTLVRDTDTPPFTESIQGSLGRPKRRVIGGRWVPPSNGRTFTTIALEPPAPVDN